ncbi:hypothetical protein JEZ13_05145 [bacterium]|nr:hypothetical protein [bacterium]
MKLRMGLLLLLILLANSVIKLSAQELALMQSSKSNIITNSMTNKFGVILGYSPLEYGFLVKLYGVPQDNDFKLRLNQLVIYVDSNGKAKGEFFEYKPMSNWTELDKYSQRVIMSLGFTNSLTKSKNMLLGLYLGMGFSSQYQQYFSTETEKYWYRETDNKFLGEVGLDIFYNYKYLSLNVGTSLQSMLNIGIGVNF